MPPEQEDLNRQLEALQRYVAGLQQQHEQAKAAAAQPPPAPEPKPQRPSRRWLLLTALLVTLALAGGVLVGAVAWSTDRPAAATIHGRIAPHAPKVDLDAILKKHGDTFPNMKLFPITDIAKDFADAHKQFIGDGSVFDAIYKPK